MGKLIHKWVRGIMPSWLFTGFRRTNTPSKKLLHLRLKQCVHFTSSKSSAPVLPPSSALSNTELVDMLIEMDQSVYYYSQSEDEQERAITGNSNHKPSSSIESNYHDDDDDQIHASKNPRMGVYASAAAASIIKAPRHVDKFEPPSPHKEFESSTSPSSINLQSHHNVLLQNRQQEECLYHPYPIQHQTRKLTTSSKETAVIKENHHNSCGGHSWQHQHQHKALSEKNYQQQHVANGPAHANEHCQHHASKKPHANQQSQHHAGDASFCPNDDPHAHHYRDNDHYMYHHVSDVIFCQHHDDDVCRSAHHHHQNNHMYKYNHDPRDKSLYMHVDDVYPYAHQYDHKNHGCEDHHDGQEYGSNNPLCMSKEGRTKPIMESQPISSFAKSAKTETQHNNDHPQHQHHDQYQNDNQFYQHNASKIDYYQPHPGGLKRKSIFYFDGIDGKEAGKDKGNHRGSMSSWPCVKRQRTQKGDDVACELPECITKKVGDSCAIVQYSYQNPEFAFWESMMQMIVSNELCDSSELEFLLHCYLALNDPHLHHIIHTSFLQVLKDLQQSIYELSWIN